MVHRRADASYRLHNLEGHDQGMGRCSTVWRAEAVELPSWINDEVSQDARYYNASLAKSPYCTWQA